MVVYRIVDGLIYDYTCV